MMNCMRYEWDMQDLSHGGPQITAQVELVIFDKGKASVKFVAPELCVKKNPYVAGNAQAHWISAHRLWDMICTSDTGREWDVIDYFLGSIAHWLVISPLHPHTSRQIACNSSRTYLHIDKAPCVKPGSIDPMALSHIPGCTPISIAISMGTIDG